MAEATNIQREREEDVENGFTDTVSEVEGGTN